jgi:deazaflavin-dependent oxidoreductase (nitroreductase family)
VRHRRSLKDLHGAPSARQATRDLSAGLGDAATVHRERASLAYGRASLLATRVLETHFFSSSVVARRYRRTAVRRLLDRLMTAMLRRGAAPPGVWLLTVPGRRTGRPYATPVSLVEDAGGRWLVAPYGAVPWVRNVRAAGRVTMSRGSRAETLAAVEVGPREAAPVLRRYLAANPVTRRYFDATRRSPLERFEAEAARHPVFRLEPT